MTDLMPTLSNEPGENDVEEQLSQADANEKSKHSEISTAQTFTSAHQYAETNQGKKSVDVPTNSSGSSSTNGRKVFTVVLLFVAYLILFIDRFTIAGVLSNVQKYFDLSDKQCGLMQTIFTCSYSTLAPVFGYLGDRHSRKIIMIGGITLWSMPHFMGSFVQPNKFWMFLTSRALIGVGQAAFSCVAPTVIGDLLDGKARIRALGLYFMAVPVGSGLGFIIGSNVAQAYRDWRYALWVTPPVCLVCVILLALFFDEPKRAGQQAQSTNKDQKHDSSSVWEDLEYLMKNKTFVWVTLGFMFSSLITGGLSWWMPTFCEYGVYSTNDVPVQIQFKFGVVACLAGFLSVAVASTLSSKLKPKIKSIDPIICGMGAFVAIPSLYITVVATRTAPSFVFWILVSTSLICMALSWSLNANVLLYAVHPKRRSIAQAIHILVSFMFGEAPSPYIIGTISDWARFGKPDTYFNRYTSFQIAFYTMPFYALFSFASYLFASIYVSDNTKLVDMYIVNEAKEFSEKETKQSVNYKLKPTTAGDAIEFRALDEIKFVDDMD